MKTRSPKILLAIRNVNNKREGKKVPTKIYRLVALIGVVLTVMSIATAHAQTECFEFAEDDDIGVDFYIHQIVANEVSDRGGGRDELYIQVVGLVPRGEVSVRLPRHRDIRDDYYQFWRNHGANVRHLSSWTNSDEEIVHSPDIWSGDLRPGDRASFTVVFANQEFSGGVQIRNAIAAAVNTLDELLQGEGYPEAGEAARTAGDYISELPANKDDLIGAFIVEIENVEGELQTRWIPLEEIKLDGRLVSSTTIIDQPPYVADFLAGLNNKNSDAQRLSMGSILGGVYKATAVIQARCPNGVDRTPISIGQELDRCNKPQVVRAQTRAGQIITFGSGDEHSFLVNPAGFPWWCDDDRHSRSDAPRGSELIHARRRSGDSDAIVWAGFVYGDYEHRLGGVRPKPTPLISPIASTAYVWADQPTAPAYTPAKAYTSAPGPVQIKRTGLGQYAVDFGGNVLGGSILGGGGNVQVTPYGSQARSCNVKSWSARVVKIACFDSITGARADARYSVLATKASGDDSAARARLAYAWGNNPTAAAYTPRATYAYNAGEPLSIERVYAGIYRVDVGAVARHRGATALVTAYGDAPVSCQLLTLYNGKAEVGCYRLAPEGSSIDDVFVDSRFSLVVYRGVPGDGSLAYATVNDYSNYKEPNLSVKLSNKERISFEKIRPGYYTIDLGENMFFYGGNVQVTAIGGFPRICSTVGWSSTHGVHVQCTDLEGNEARSSFNVTAIR